LIGRRRRDRRGRRAERDREGEAQLHRRVPQAGAGAKGDAETEEHRSGGI